MGYEDKHGTDVHVWLPPNTITVLNDFQLKEGLKRNAAVVCLIHRGLNNIPQQLTTKTGIDLNTLLISAMIPSVFLIFGRYANDVILQMLGIISLLIPVCILKKMNVSILPQRR